MVLKVTAIIDAHGDHCSEDCPHFGDLDGVKCCVLFADRRGNHALAVDGGGYRRQCRCLDLKEITCEET